MKKIEELNDDEIARVRAQQAPCHFGNCTQKEYAAIEWPDVDDKHPLIWVGGMPRSGTVKNLLFSSEQTELKLTFAIFWE